MEWSCVCVVHVVCVIHAYIHNMYVHTYIRTHIHTINVGNSPLRMEYSM